jgi:prepilin-type N-terminal cleavage/methylation domain-containing protein
MCFPSNIRIPENRARGFTVLELMVVSAIIGIIVTVVFAGYRQFDSKALLQSLAYEMALAVREAQVLSTAVRAQGGDYGYNFGIQFDMSTTPINERRRYKITARDPSSNNSEAATAVTTFDITRGNSIRRLRTCNASWDGADINSTNCSNRAQASVYFTRPHFETEFFINGTKQPSVNAMVIELQSPGGATTGYREIRIWRSGQVDIR